jgi:hypothetical protein
VVATLKRLARDDSGQALAEYGILLTLAAGFDRLQDMTDSFVSDHPTAALIIVLSVVALVLSLALSQSRKI